MKSCKQKILVVDDNPMFTYTLEMYLQQDYSIKTVETGHAALQESLNEAFDLIILDVILPDINGLDLCRKIKSRSSSCNTPIIFISSVDDTQGKLNGFRAGGVDYITKPFVLEEVKSRVATQIDLHLLRQGLEERVSERTKELEAEIERRRIAEASLQRLSTAVVQAPLTVMIVGTNGLIEYVNPTFTRSTGYLPAEVIGQNPRFLKSGYTSQGEYEKLWKAITSGETWRGEFLTVRKNGTQFWESVTMAPVKDACGKIMSFVCIKEDITGKKQRDNELLAAKVKAESGSKAKSDFLTMVSHELRTPLNAVIGFSEFLTMELHGPLGDAHYKEYANRIVEAGRHLLHIVTQIIDLTQVEAGRLDIRNEIFEIKQIVDDACSLAKSSKDIQCMNVVTHVEGDMLMEGDQQLIRQVLINIVQNAMIFTPKEGEIEVRVQKGYKNFLEFIVSDNGVGICAEQLQKVLEPFEQAENVMTRTHDGLGLGLPLAKLMTEAHGGALKLESTKGVGTKVIVRFPSNCVISI